MCISLSAGGVEPSTQFSKKGEEGLTALQLGNYFMCKRFAVPYLSTHIKINHETGYIGRFFEKDSKMYPRPLQ